MHYMQDQGDVKDEYGNNVQGANNDLDQFLISEKLELRGQTVIPTIA